MRVALLAAILSVGVCLAATPARDAQSTRWLVGGELTPAELCPSLLTERDESAWDMIDADPLPAWSPPIARAADSVPLVGHNKGAHRDDMLPGAADKKLEFAKDPAHAFSDADSDIFSKASALSAMIADTQVYDAGEVQDQLARRYAPKRWDVIEALPPVENQKQQGSCSAFATAYYGLHTLIKWRHITELRDKLNSKAAEPEVAAVRSRIGTVNKRFSPAYIYNQINKGQDKGSSIGDAFKLMAASGCAQWDDMPYNDADFKTGPTAGVRAKASDWKGQIKRIWFIPRETRLRVLQVFLSRGRPVIISMYVHSDFEKFTAPSRDKAVYSPPASQKVDFTSKENWHAMCLFGFNNEREGGCFILVNSWGIDWGYKGIAYIKYADFWNYASYAYSVE